MNESFINNSNEVKEIFSKISTSKDRRERFMYSTNLLQPISELVSMGEELDKSTKYETQIDKIQVLENLLEKFPRVIRLLQERRKDKEVSRPTLTIKDEYDVQDLLCSLLQIDFKIVKKEVGTEHHAGGTSRIDLVLDDEEIIIEVKMVRASHTIKNLADELFIDIERYLQKNPCKFLYFFIYDPSNILPNLAELEKDVNRKEKDTIIKVIFVPKK